MNSKTSPTPVSQAGARQHPNQSTGSSQATPSSATSRHSSQLQLRHESSVSKPPNAALQPNTTASSPSTANLSRPPSNSDSRVQSPQQADSVPPLQKQARNQEDDHMSSVKVLPSLFEDASPEDVIVLVGDMLTRLTTHNDTLPLHPSSLTRFHSRATPTISLPSYLRRIAKYTSLEKSCMLILLVYIDRVCERMSGFTICGLTVHRFVCAAVVCASKALCDAFSTNTHYARVGGISLVELNMLEKEFLNIIDWHLTCSGSLLQHYYTSLVRSHPSYTLAELPPLEKPGHVQDPKPEPFLAPCNPFEVHDPTSSSYPASNDGVARKISASPKAANAVHSENRRPSGSQERSNGGLGGQRRDSIQLVDTTGPTDLSSTLQSQDQPHPYVESPVRTRTSSHSPKPRGIPPSSVALNTPGSDYPPGHDTGSGSGANSESSSSLGSGSILSQHVSSAVVSSGIPSASELGSASPSHASLSVSISQGASRSSPSGLGEGSDSSLSVSVSNHKASASRGSPASPFINTTGITYSHSPTLPSKSPSSSSSRSPAFGEAHYQPRQQVQTHQASKAPTNGHFSSPPWSSPQKRERAGSFEDRPDLSSASTSSPGSRHSSAVRRVQRSPNLQASSGGGVQSEVDARAVERSPSSSTGKGFSRFAASSVGLGPSAARELGSPPYSSRSPFNTSSKARNGAFSSSSGGTPSPASSSNGNLGAAMEMG